MLAKMWAIELISLDEKKALLMGLRWCKIDPWSWGLGFESCSPLIKIVFHVTPRIGTYFYGKFEINLVNHKWIQESAKKDSNPWPLVHKLQSCVLQLAVRLWFSKSHQLKLLQSLKNCFSPSSWSATWTGTSGRTRASRRTCAATAESPSSTRPGWRSTGLNPDPSFKLLSRSLDLTNFLFEISISQGSNSCRRPVLGCLQWLANRALGQCKCHGPVGLARIGQVSLG